MLLIKRFGSFLSPLPRDRNSISLTRQSRMTFNLNYASSPLHYMLSLSWLEEVLASKHCFTPSLYHYADDMVLPGLD